MNSTASKWKLVCLNQLGRWIGGGTPSKGNPTFWAPTGIPWVSPKDMKRLYLDDAEDHITRTAVEESSTNIVAEGSVLVVTRSGILGHTLPVAKVLRPVAINQDIKALTTYPEVSPDYVLHALRALQDRILQECGKSGTTVANLDTDRFLNFQIPLPPLDVQRSIVETVLSLSERSKKAHRELSRIADLVVRYKQAVFAAGSSGNLTSDWRNGDASSEEASTLLRRIHAGLSKQYHPRKGSPEDEAVPKTWVWCKVSDVGDVVLGRQRSPRHHSGTHMRPYLRVANVFENRIDTCDVMEMNFTPSEYKRFKLEPGDILLNEGQSKELIGRPAMFRGELDNVCFTNTLVRFRAYPPISAAYALLIFRYYFRSGLFQSIANITTNIAHLGAGRFADLPFPLPPLAEQAEIVKRCAFKVDAIEMVGAHASKALAQIERLEQATLAKAFRGELLEFQQKHSQAVS